MCLLDVVVNGNSHVVEVSDIDPYADNGRGSFDMVILKSLRSTFCIDPSEEIKQLKHDVRVILVRANKLLDM